MTERWPVGDVRITSVVEEETLDNPGGEPQWAEVWRFEPVAPAAA